MSSLFSLLFTLCLVALFIGLIKPGLVIRWGDQTQKTRKGVLKYYGIGLLLFFALSTAFAGNPESDPKDANNTSDTVAVQEETTDVDKSAALEVDNQIAALGDVESLTLDKSDEIQTVRASYDSLDAEQQGYVANIAVLTSAEAKIVDLQAAADEQAAAQAEAERVAAAQAEADRAAAEAQKKAEVEAAQAQNSYTVYITETGEKYHRDGCQYLRQSQIAITKSDAINAGYTPCSRCNP